MKHGYIKAAAFSPRIELADPYTNAKLIGEILTEAEREKISLAVFPELCLTGATAGDLFVGSTLINGAREALHSLARSTRGLKLLALVGLPIEVSGRLYSAAAAISDGEILGIVPRTHFSPRDELDGKRYFSRYDGENRDIYISGERVTFGTKQLFLCRENPDISVAVEVSEDASAPLPPSVFHRAAGASVISCLSASAETVSSEEYRRLIARSGSARLACPYIIAEAGEGESSTDLSFSGHSLIAEDGRIVAERAPFGKGECTAVIDCRHSVYRRRELSLPDEPDGYTVSEFSLGCADTELRGVIDPMPFLPRERANLPERCRRIVDIQRAALARRIRASHAKGAVIAVSGGLDSCLALLVTAEAFDMLGMPRNLIRTYTLPCFGTTKRTRSNAEILSVELGTDFSEIDITESVKLHFRDIGHDESVHNVVYENCQARERTQVIMDIANADGSLVIGTGDLSELALGWATYNGDHMSSYGVNAGIPKTLVRHVVAYLRDSYADGGRQALAAVLTDILDTPVSPELLPPDGEKIAQKTEDIVGPYGLHDFFIYRFTVCGDCPAKILRCAESAFEGVYSREVIKVWLKVFLRRFFTQQFKRSCLPDGVKVGRAALSPRGAWRMPSDSSSALWIDSLGD